MKNYSKYAKGSEWRKWDLHVHTPLDCEWVNRPDLSDEGKKEQFAKEFVEFAKADELSVLCITDHNFCNKIEDLLIPYIQREAKEKDITILPGFEIASKDGSGIHLLIIFPENTLLENIKGIVDQCFPPNTDLIPQNGNCPVSNKSIDEINKIIIEAKQKAIFVFAHSDRENGILGKNTITGERRVQEWKKDFINIAQISKSPDEYPKNTFMYNVVNKIDPYYDRDITYVISSDCRTIDKEENREGRCHLGQKFVWIKADPTFEGLKQIVYEPDDRVRIQQDRPEEKTPYAIIDSVRFLDSREQRSFNGEWIKLNQNLNSIIGGKSSGKSLLLYYIAKTIDADRIDKVEKNAKGAYPQASYDLEKYPEFDFEVKWADAKSYKLSDSDKPNRPITYIPQLYLNRLAEDKKEELNNLVDNMLKESNEEYKAFRKQTKQKLNEIKTNILNSIDEYFKIKSELSDKTREIKKFGDEDAIIKNRNKIKEKMEKVRKESSFSEEEEKKYGELTRTIRKQKAQLSETKTFVNALSATKESYERFKSTIKEMLENTAYSSISHLEPSPEIQEKISGIVSHTVGKLQNTMDEEIKTRFSVIGKEERKLSASEKELENASKALGPLEEKVKNKELFLNLQKKLAVETKKLESFKKQKNEINRLEKSLSIEPIKDKYRQMFGCYNSIVEENRKYELIPDTDNLELSSKVEIDKEKFAENFIRKVDKRRPLKQQFGDFFNDQNEYVYNPNDHLSNINSMTDKLLSGAIPLNAGFEEKQAVISLLEDCFFIDYNLLQDGDDLIKMSPGKRGIILFQLFLHLSKSENPILIDQPEDNLDNRTVYQELNDFIKTKKSKRQIIIISHNPNLVVSTDSENVIIANQNGQNKSGKNKEFRFEYVNGSLEHSFAEPDREGVLFQRGVREHVCDILEGGEEAFEKRENKYGFRK